MELRAPDRLREVALDAILKPQEVVTGAGLPVLRLGLDGPGGDIGGGLAVGRRLRAAQGGGKLVKPGELPQFGPEHAVVLRQPARIVSLDVDDMAVLNTPQPSPGSHSVSSEEG